MTKIDFFYLYIQIKTNMKKSKSEVSVSLNNDILEYIKEKFSNRSKFIEYCIVQELIKIEKFKEKIDKMIL